MASSQRARKPSESTAAARGDGNRLPSAAGERAAPGQPPGPPDLHVVPTVHWTVLTLTNETCRWPIGDPREDDFRFCGVATADLAAKRPYCFIHHCTAYGAPPITLTAKGTLP